MNTEVITLLNLNPRRLVLPVDYIMPGIDTLSENVNVALLLHSLRFDVIYMGSSAEEKALDVIAYQEY